MKNERIGKVEGKEGTGREMGRHKGRKSGVGETGKQRQTGRETKSTGDGGTSRWNRNRRDRVKRKAGGAGEEDGAEDGGYRGGQVRDSTRKAQRMTRSKPVGLRVGKTG